MNRRALLLVSILALALSAASSARAQLETVGRRIQVSGDATLGVDSPAVAIDAEGRAMVVWSTLSVEGGGEQVARIYGQLLRADGTPAGAPRTIDDSPAELQFYPDLSAVGAGRFVVVWSRWDPHVFDFEFQAYEIVGRLTDAAGRPRGAQFHVNVLSPFWQLYPAVAAAPDDGFFAVWVTGDVGDAGPWPAILGGRRFRADGTPAGPELQVNNLGTSPADSYDPRTVAVATALTGDSMVVWASQDDIFAQRYDAGGEALGAETRVDETDGRMDRGPAVAADAAGDFVVTWASSETFFSPAEVRARAIDRRGVAGPMFPLGVTIGGHEAVTALAGDPFGHFAAAWTVADSPSQSRVAVRELAATGEPLGEPVLVAGPGRTAGAPDVAVGPGGDFLLVFAGLSAAPEDGVRIFSQRLRRQAAACVPSPTALCLRDERFRVEVTWKDFSGHAGVGRGVPLTADTGYFWFFNADNVELVVKVLDGRAVNGHYWVFFGALSTVEYTVRVTDTETGEIWTRFNPAGTLASVADTAAF